jgi:hypothetical protein
MSTERAREKTVAELDLQNLTDDEAIRLLIRSIRLVSNSI